MEVTVSEWQLAQAVALLATPPWPLVAGGKPWQLEQVVAAPFQAMEALPAEPLGSLAPWQ